MIYFNPLLPFNKVHKNFDLNTEEFSKEKVGVLNHFKEDICDGVLVSRTMYDTLARGQVIKTDEGVKFLVNGIEHNNLYEALGIPKHLLIMFDPGTWSYAQKLELPKKMYDTESLIDMYDAAGVVLGGSVDWPIIDKIKIEGKNVELGLDIKEKRRQITLELADDFVTKAGKRDLNFMPFGTIQGYDLKTYADSAKKILSMPYDYIAIGGLPASSEQFCLKVFKVVWREIVKSGRKVGIHAYGRFPSPTAVKDFRKYGITSVDNNYSHICAIGKTTCSYWSTEFWDEDVYSPLEKCYQIMIPSERSPKIRRAKKVMTEESYDELLGYYNKAFYYFCAYDTNRAPKIKQRILENFVKGETMLADTGAVRAKSKPAQQRIYDLAELSLDSNIWDTCDCTGCKGGGIHMIMSRGTTRQSLIFGHNTLVQWKRLDIELKKLGYKTPPVIKELRLLHKNNKFL